MDPATYQRLAARTECDQSAARTRHYSAGEYPTQMQRFLHGALGVAAEGGELLDLYQKFVQYGQCDTKLPLPLLKEKVADELGDVFWYAALVANAFNLDLAEVMAANLRKLVARYPDKYTDQHAAERDRTAEAEAVRGSGDKAWDRIVGGLRAGQPQTADAERDAQRLSFARGQCAEEERKTVAVNNPADGRPDLKAFPPRPEDPE